MRFALVTARKDLTRIFRDPLALLVWITMPAVMTGLIAIIFGSGGGALPRGTLLLVDQDNSFASAIVRAVFSRDPLTKMVLVEPVEYEAGRKRLDAGDASALLIIPKGFGSALLGNRPSTLTLITNPAQRILPGIIQEALSTLTDGAFYAQSLVGDQLAKFAGAPPTQMDMLALSIEAGRLSTQLNGYLNPPLIDFDIQTIAPEKKPVPIGALFFPGMLMFAVFGFAQSMSEDIWRERAQGTIKRVLSTSRTIGSFLAGKLMALGLVFGVLAAAGIAVAHLALAVSIHNAVIAALWVAGSGAGLYLMAALLQVFSTEQRAGVVLNGFVMFVLGMVGGSFFPLEIMPAWLASVGRVTPNGWAITRYKEIVAGPVDPARLLYGFAMLAAFLLIASLFLSRRLRRWAV